MVITSIVLLLLLIVGPVIGGVLGSRKKEATDEEASGVSGTDIITTDKILTMSVVVTTNGVASTSDATTTQEIVSMISRTSATEVSKPTKSANSNFLFPVEKKMYRILNDDDDTLKALAAPGIGDEVIIQPPSAAEQYQLWQVVVCGNAGQGMNGMVYSISNVARAHHIIADVMIEGQSGQNTFALRLRDAPLEPASLWYFEAPYADKEHSKKALLINVMLSGWGSVGWDGDKAEMEAGGYREWYLEEVDVPGV